ncbi:MAG TPA: serine/threonine-protein kinase [Polyangia bacterium]|nr:serine/threonine-protein kinase [Polyangia bacterium]
MTNSDRESGHETAFSPGDLVGERYRIVRLVGAGSTGEVYEAIDQALGGAVALKTLKQGFSNQPVLLERFRREIQNARRVTHPNVCRIFDMGVHRVRKQQRFFLTMELLSGESLAAYLAEREALSSAEALPLLTQIAAGLQAAHDSGVTHRDLKPGNVVLVAGPPPRAIITDFGLAISVEQVGMGLTESSELIGTPEYMAPEQIEPSSVTPAADIYALGIIAYEMLAKHPPFEPGGTPIATVLKRRHESPRPLRQLVPGVEPAWEAAILRCLEREPERRFRRPADFIAALTSPPEGPPERDGWVRRATRKLRGR